jgi:hypothetical protein
MASRLSSRKRFGHRWLQRGLIAHLRELLGAMPPEEKAANPVQETPATEETVLPPCPCCGGRMAVIEYFERGTLPRYRPFSAAVIWFDTS